MIAALAPIVRTEIGVPTAEFDVLNAAEEGDWAWLTLQPHNADGSPIDWSRTALASRHEHGAMDESGATYALLKRESGAWRVITHVIGPTDVAWLDWPSQHGAPVSLFDPAP